MSSFCDLFHYHLINFDSLESFSRIKLTNVYITRILNTFASEHLQAQMGFTR